MNLEIFESVDRYISDLLANEDEALQEAVVSMDRSFIPPMNVSANQGKFLQVLAKLTNAKNILEIGTCAGYSTIWLARALPESGKLITLEADEEYAGIAQQNIDHAGLSHKVEIKTGKALEVLPIIAEENAAPFDMIFIDADKPPYKEYFDWAIKLSRPGTVIVADNVIRDGKVLDEQSPDEKVRGVQRLNKSLADNVQVTATIIQTVGSKDHDGMVIAVVN